MFCGAGVELGKDTDTGGGFSQYTDTNTSEWKGLGSVYLQK